MQLAEPRIAISVGMPLGVLVPQDLQRDVLVFQLAVNRRPIGRATPPVPLLLSGCGEELLFEHPVGHVGRQWPTQTRSSEPLQRQPNVDDATPTRRAISLLDTPAASNRSTSRTWRIAILSAGIVPSCGKSKGTDAKRASRDALYPGDFIPEIPGEIISERRAKSNRIGGRSSPT